MDYEKILERIYNVYQESVMFYHPVEKEQDEQNKAINIPNKLIHNSYVTEIDGNYLLFFNEIYTNTIRKWLKNILKKIAWPIFKRQIYYNSAVRQILYNLIQKSDEYSTRDREVNERLSQLEQKVEQYSKLEQKVEQYSQLEQKVEQLSQLEQKVEQLSAELQVNNNVASQFASAEEAKIKSGLWFNDPIWVGHRDNGEAYWVETTERILEKTFVLHSLAYLYQSRHIEILDVGAAESLLSYELASFNYSVTAIDIRPIVLFHPNLKFVQTDICKPVLPPASFDCVIALSTLEHIGLGWYGDETGESYDVKAVQQISLLLKPQGSFILTVPYGKKALTPVHRIYNQESLQKLIQDFKIIQISYGVRKDEFTWTITENELEASEKEHNQNNYLPGAVAMLVCKKNLV
ncbi:TPR domain protein [Nostoc commune NIES-4072]|uniref:TPR domain protein n=1 Tax=Nostoc commune NIES-4072 TaxID=2005467 RepID=A0A2R5FT89_NOSCO|nr:class I SAM-dependent methyltransferase [Nostoc commune]BBD67493.1 TPR domain protein [Nostoc commune HK-02]GBG21525.1 TPR domain protein [Nostoc commune NIES-4072]